VTAFHSSTTSVNMSILCTLQRAAHLYPNTQPTSSSIHVNSGTHPKDFLSLAGLSQAQTPPNLSLLIPVSLKYTHLSYSKQCTRGSPRDLINIQHTQSVCIYRPSTHTMIHRANTHTLITNTKRQDRQTRQSHMIAL
jgi:hypothetical protein